MDNILALSEEDIKLRYITPSILQKGWSADTVAILYLASKLTHEYVYSLVRVWQKREKSKIRAKK